MGIQLPPNSTGTVLRTINQAGVEEGDEREVVVVSLPDGSFPERQRIRLDDAGRADGQPVYVGIAPQATLDSGTWMVKRLSYNSKNNVVDVQVLFGAWTNRATLGWL